MLFDARQQKTISEQKRMPTNNINSEAVTDIAAETIQLYYYSTGVRTIDAGQLAGVTVIAKIANSNILDSNGTATGTFSDTSFEFITGTILTTQVDFPYNTAEQYKDSTPLIKATQIIEDFANGEFCIDHETGTIYGVKATAGVSDTANYKCFISVTGGGGGIASDVNIDKVGGTDTAVDDSAMAATPPFLPVGGEYRNAATTYADGDATVLQTDVNGKLKVAMDADIEIGAVEIKDGTTDARQAVKVDNATATATPTVALVGAHYKATLDTYTDNDASPLHTDVNGLLKIVDTPSASAENAPSAFRVTDLDETPAQAIKASAGNVYGWNFYNPNAYDVFVKLYNTAVGSVTVGTTAVVETIQVPSLGSVVIKQDTPIKSFSTAISIAATKLVADADTTALDADVFAHVYYK